MSFTATADDVKYAFDLDLNGEIDVENSTKSVNARQIELKIKKKADGFCTGSHRFYDDIYHGPPPYCSPLSVPIEGGGQERYGVRFADLSVSFRQQQPPPHFIVTLPLIGPDYM